MDQKGGWAGVSEFCPLHRLGLFFVGFRILNFTIFGGSGKSGYFGRGYVGKRGAGGGGGGVGYLQVVFFLFFFLSLSKLAIFGVYQNSRYFFVVL